jgi:hypothetical protein
MLAAVSEVKWELKKEYNLSEFENNNKKARAVVKYGDFPN